MIFDVIDKKIRNAFSDAAMQYDMLTGLHKEIGRELTKKIMDQEPCAAVLDIGMGTGWFTKRLSNVFSDALVVGIDFADGMIVKAREKENTFKVIQADALHLPFRDDQFDLITSNLAYQWVGDLERSFGRCRSLLKKDGRFCFTMFGRETFCELFEALNACADGKTQNHVRLADEKQVTNALKEVGFGAIDVTSERIKVRFQDMLSLVKWVKDIGANTLPKNMYIGKDLLLRTNEYYNTRFRDRLGVYATFEVIWVEAKR